MRALPLPLPLGAITFLSGIVGALTSTRHQGQRSADDAKGERIADDRPRTHSQAGRTLRSNPSPIHISSGSLASTIRTILKPPSQLLPLACFADASGYDAMETTIPAATPAPSTFLVSTTDATHPEDDDSDTITGVFHRLDPQRAKLLLVQVVFRHGARTPLSSRSEMWRGQQWDVCGQAYQAAAMRLFSTAGVENPVSKHDMRQRSVILDGGCRKGELTLLGQSQALELGRWLRKRYVAEEVFLPPTHRGGLVEARTTNTSRTVATLRGVLTGLYPDLPKQQQQPGGQQQQQQQQQQGSGEVEEAPSRVPVVTTSGDLDEILYADTRACPHLGSFQAMSREAGRAAVRSDPDYGWARGELLRLMGLDASAFDSDRWIFTDVHDVLTSLSAHGKQLPPGFEQQPRLRAVINRLATKEFGAEVAPSVRDSYGRTVLRLSMGRLLHTLVGNMQQAAAATAAVEAAAAGGVGKALATGSGPGTQPRMYLYSGHDSTIMPLLSALGLDVTHWPPYSSNLVFELWQLQPKAPGSAPRHVVRVLYNQEELPLPHCPPGFQPSLHTFEREVVGPFLLSSQRYQELCAVRVEHEGSMPQTRAPRPKASAPAAAE